MSVSIPLTDSACVCVHVWVRACACVRGRACACVCVCVHLNLTTHTVDMTKNTGPLTHFKKESQFSVKYVETPK